MPSRTSGSSRRSFLSGRGCGVRVPLDPEAGEGLHRGRDARHGRRGHRQARRVEVGARYAGALRRSRQDGEERRDDAGGAEEVRPAEPAAREDAQVRRDREVSALHRIDRHLLRQAQRSGSDGRQRRRQDPDDDGEPVEEQDPAGDGAAQVAHEFHPGGGRGAERPGSVRGGEGGGRRRGRGHRRRGRDAERHSGGGGRAGPRAAHRQAAQPEAARDAVLRRRRPARQGICRPQGAGAQDHRTERRDVRGDEEVRPEHGDLQRRRHRHLQHHARGARVHRRAGGQLPVHGHAVPGDRQRERRRGVQRLRAVADRADHGDEQPVPGAVDDRCRHQGADAQHAGARRHRRAGDGIQRPAPTSSAASGSRPRRRSSTRSATCSR